MEVGKDGHQLLQEVLDLLGSIPLLQRLPAPSIKELARVGQPRHFEKGAHIVKEGEAQEGLFIVWKGEAVISSAEDGKEQPLHVGNYFGHACRGAPKHLHKSDVLAYSQVTLCFFIGNNHGYLLKPASTWRSEPAELGPLERLLQLNPAEDDLFQTNSMPTAPSFWKNMYGGHMVGLALAAACKTVNPMLEVHSLHSYFIRPARPASPIMYKVERTRDGHTFATRHVQAIQKGKIMFTMYASFQRGESGLEYQDPMPSTPSPDKLPTYEDLLSPLCTDTRISKHNREASTSCLKMGETLDLRYVNRRPVDTLDPLPPKQRVWMRTKGRLSDDPALHKCATAYAFDWSFLETALGPHNKLVNTYPIDGRSLDHSMWFHRPCRADEWLLAVMESPRACNSRAICFGQVFTQSGELVISLTQEGMIRVFKTPQENQADHKNQQPVSKL